MLGTKTHSHVFVKQVLYHKAKYPTSHLPCLKMCICSFWQGVHVLACGSKGTLAETCSPFTTSAPGAKLRCSGLAAGTFIPWAILLALFFPYRLQTQLFYKTVDKEPKLSCETQNTKLSKSSIDKLASAAHACETGLLSTRPYWITQWGPGQP